MTRVLVIAAHPDDEVLGVGGTILRHKAEGHDVRAAVLYPCAVRSDLAQRQQLAEAAEKLDIRIDFIVDDLDEYVAEVMPDVVYTHSAADLHHEHQQTLQRALVACRPQSGVRGLYAFETPSATDWSGRVFDPHLFVDITDTIDDKMEAMRVYDAEMRKPPHPRNIDGLYTRAEYWGQRAGVGWAEAFEVIRECW